MTSSRPEGLARVADDFYLMANDDASGRPRLPERILGLALAGALLGELCGINAIDVVNGTVVVTGLGEIPQDLIGEVLNDVRQERRRPVREWLDYLSPTACEAVAKRLASSHLLYFKPSRVSRFGRRGRWTPVDVHRATWPAIDVASRVFHHKADARTLMLLGLARATGLDNPCMWEIRDRLKDPAVLELTLAPLARSHPPLLALIASVETAVGSAVTSQRSG